MRMRASYEPSLRRKRDATLTGALTADPGQAPSSPTRFSSRCRRKASTPPPSGGSVRLVGDGEREAWIVVVEHSVGAISSSLPEGGWARC
jgi:hypothetical protein